MSAFVASIPSPSSGALTLGPLSIHAYGLMIALGVIAAVWLFGRRLELMHIGTREDASAVAVWAVVAGVIGSRLYHVVTDWSTFSHDLGRIPQLWRGGLGIPGGLLFGTLAGLYAFKRRGVPVALGVTAATPAVPLAQAIGRWGNWWNQELFGKATTLPWALRIDDDKVPAGFAPGTTFHPTFLYESLWSFGLCIALLWIDRHVKLRPGRLFPIYVVGYSIGRFWIEGLRIDPAHHAGGLRLNQWVAMFTGLVAAGYLVVDWYLHRGEVDASDQDLQEPGQPEAEDPDANHPLDEVDSNDLSEEHDPDDLAADLAADLPEDEESEPALEAVEPDLRESLD